MEKKIVLMDSYMTSLNKLSNQERKQAVNTIKQMQIDLSTPSLKVHDLSGTKCDSKFRSARVSSDIRIIFLLDGDFCTLLYVDHHDAAYDWCEGKYYKKTDFGASYIYDTVVEKQKISRMDEQLKEAVYYGFADKPLFEGKLTQKQLEKLGIKGIHAQNILKIVEEDDFTDYIQLFPEELQEALIDIYTETKAFDEVYMELEDSAIKNDLLKDTSLSLLQKDSGRRFYVIGSQEEIERMAEVKNFEKWTTFLHPSQKKYAQINAKGPVLIEGGPGTGKTVLGMHRAAYLSQNVYKKEDGKRILFCTFSKKLSRYISENIDTLYTQKGIPMNVDVVGVDAFFAKYANCLYPYTNAMMAEILSIVFAKNNWEKYTAEFLKYEFYQIIQRYGINTLEKYLEADRKGMKIPLNKNQRTFIWKYFEEVKRLQKIKNVYTFVDRAMMMEEKIDCSSLMPMYDAIIIDEAQDLEPAKLRVLSKCCKNADNGLMILSDFNQRIFTLNSWKNDTTINVVGRTYYLSVNYRTTKEISDYACVVFFQDKDMTDYMKSYKSVVLGNDPIVQGCKDEKTQTKIIIATIAQLKKRNNRLNDVCIVFPFQKEVDNFKTELDKVNIKSLVLKDDVIPADADCDAVCLCTTKGIKGLEFTSIVLGSSHKIGLLGKEKQNAELYVNADLKKQRECERYVAVTRARENLFVTYVEE